MDTPSCTWRGLEWQTPKAIPAQSVFQGPSNQREVTRSLTSPDRTLLLLPEPMSIYKLRVLPPSLTSSPGPAPHHSDPLGRSVPSGFVHCLSSCWEHLLGSHLIFQLKGHVLRVLPCPCRLKKPRPHPGPSPFHNPSQCLSWSERNLTSSRLMELQEERFCVVHCCIPSNWHHTLL